MSTNTSGISDGATVANSDIVGNEQYADAEGISGPDPAQWPADTRPPEPEFVPGEEGAPTKGPDPAQHPASQPAE